MSDHKVYEYDGCGTCRKARKYLEARQIACRLVPIREKPPTRAELKRMLAIYDGNVKKLFNTSGRDYRAEGLGEKLAGMTTEQAIDLLATNGNLVKRPFLLTKSGGAVGFSEASWDTLLARD